MTAPYAIDHPDELLSPSLVLFKPVLEHNLHAMIELAGGTGRLRPHCKTHKLAQVVKMQLDLGITRQKAATIAEAEMLARTGCRDVMLAYNPVGPNIPRAAELARTFPDVSFSVTADDPGMIQQLGEAASARSVTLGVALDLNPGRDRTGLPPGDNAAELYRLISRTAGLQPAGFHLYDGHQHQADFHERSAAVQTVLDRVLEFRDRLVHEGLDVPRIVCGGTPTFPVYAQLDDPAIELSPGTLIFHDAGYGEKFPDLHQFRPAALVFTRVISRPTPQRVTFDCGTKSVASDPPMGSRLVFPDLPDAIQVLHNEEHLVVETPDAGRWSVGDWTLAIPRHVCPTTALHREISVFADGRHIDTWTITARDRRLTI